MEYSEKTDWQQFSPAWREMQIHECLCGIKTALEDYFASQGTQPLVYRALLSQSGTDAPTAVVLENTLGEVPTFTYQVIGAYTIDNVSGLFTANKTFVLVNSIAQFSEGDFIGVIRTLYNSPGSINLYSLQSTVTGGTQDAFAPANGVLNGTEIQILVYA